MDAEDALTANDMHSFEDLMEKIADDFLDNQPMVVINPKITETTRALMRNIDGGHLNVAETDTKQVVSIVYS